MRKYREGSQMCPRDACWCYSPALVASAALSILTGSISPLMRGLHVKGAYSSAVETSVAFVAISVFCTERLLN